MEAEVSQLLIDIRNKSNINVVKVSDVKLLEEDIKFVTNTSVSFNTLRRLYGFLPKTSFSKKTLDTLSKYLGFNSYSGYINNRNIYDSWYFKMKLLRMEKDNLDFTKSDLISFYRSLYNNVNVVLISDYIGSLISKQNTNALVTFFSSLEYVKVSDSTKVKFAIITTHGFYKLDDKNKINLYEKLIHLDSFRNCIPFYNIDYSHLNGYYSSVLELIKKLNHNKSEVLFVALMEFLKSFYGNEKNVTIKIKLPAINTKLHPVLMSRYFGYLILNESILTTTLKKDINDYLNKIDPKLFLIEIIPSLIIKEEFEYLDTIFNKYYEEIFTRDRWTADGQSFNFLIGLANVNIFNNNIKAAKINLNLIDLEKVELGYTDYLTLFYNVTWLKIMFLEENTLQQAYYYSEIKRLATKIGFYKFLDIANQYKQV